MQKLDEMENLLELENIIFKQSNTNSNSFKLFNTEILNKKLKSKTNISSKVSNIINNNQDSIKNNYIIKTKEATKIAKQFNVYNTIIKESKKHSYKIIKKLNKVNKNLNSSSVISQLHNEINKSVYSIQDKIDTLNKSVISMNKKIDFTFNQSLAFLNNKQNLKIIFFYLIVFKIIFFIMQFLFQNIHITLLLTPILLNIILIKSVPYFEVKFNINKQELYKFLEWSNHKFGFLYGLIVTLFFSWVGIIYMLLYIYEYVIKKEKTSDIYILNQHKSIYTLSLFTYLFINYDNANISELVKNIKKIVNANELELENIRSFYSN